MAVTRRSEQPRKWAHVPKRVELTQEEFVSLYQGFVGLAIAQKEETIVSPAYLVEQWKCKIISSRT